MSTQPTFEKLGTSLSSGDELTRVADIDPRLRRSYYFDGRLLTATDLTRDQVYVDERVREVGRSLGSGVVEGLGASLLSDGRIRVEPGIGLTSAGRVLEVTGDLFADVSDKATILALNGPGYQRLSRGLYAVVARYAEVYTDIAEVFPSDLGAKRAAQFDAITEGVELGLVPLPQPLPNTGELSARASLLTEFLDPQGAAGLLPEDSLPLGVLAVANDAPLWLDADLLRHGLRREGEPGALQDDLRRRYDVLLDKIITERRSGARVLDFPASEYFRLLPPTGTLPKEALDPEEGRQGYFPEHFNVWVAPVRQQDLPRLQQDALLLEPVDLGAKEPTDVVILAPLVDADYAYYAQRLERDWDPTERRLPIIDLMRLRLYARQPIHRLDTDAGYWREIWERLVTGVSPYPVYVRRPPRSAETGVSAVVLARGFELPPREPMATAPPPTTEQPSPTTEQPPSDVVVTPVPDESEILLGRINLDLLGALRPAQSPEGQEAHKALSEKFGKDEKTVLSCLFVLLRIERHYDPVIWQTLRLLAANSLLDRFFKGLMELQTPEGRTGEAVPKLADSLGLGQLDASVLEGWKKLAEEGP
jgi:hypothetical protein